MVLLNEVFISLIKAKRKHVL